MATAPVIPISPSSLSTAQPYTKPLASIPSRLSERPIDPTTGKPQKGSRFVPIAMEWNAAPCQLVDLSQVSTLKPFTQCASLYVDNTNSLHDVTIYFPDSGWAARVPFGGSSMLNPLTSQALPKFYVILDSGNAVSPTDVTNLFAVDTFIPPQESPIYDRTIAYGYGEMFTLVPTFTQSQNFFNIFNSAVNPISPTPLPIINNSQWYMTALDLRIQFAGSAPDIAAITLYDNASPIWQLPFSVADATNQITTLISLSGLNFVSSGEGPLNILIADTDITSYVVFSSIMGGVLVT